jgi:hypothetical protein
MNSTFIGWIDVLGTSCWGVCFWWMHRLSSRQEAMLQELHAQGKRIEGLSKSEHALIKEMHPKVESIQDDMNDMAVAVKARQNPEPAASSA